MIKTHVKTCSYTVFYVELPTLHSKLSILNLRATEILFAFIIMLVKLHSVLDKIYRCAFEETNINNENINTTLTFFPL